MTNKKSEKNWGTKTTYLVNTDCQKIPIRVQIKKESN